MSKNMKGKVVKAAEGQTDRSINITVRSTHMQCDIKHAHPEEHNSEANSTSTSGQGDGTHPLCARPVPRRLHRGAARAVAACVGDWPRRRRVRGAGAGGGERRGEWLDTCRLRCVALFAPPSMRRCASVPARSYATSSSAARPAWRAAPRYANTLRPAVNATLKEIEAAGTYKKERLILGKQAAQIRVRESREPVLNFCANNYLGLSDNAQLTLAGACAP